MFQFLIGNLVTLGVIDIEHGIDEFQFLIGNLVTNLYTNTIKALIEFQFLIGNLVTNSCLWLPKLSLRVSIPYRKPSNGALLRL